MTKIRLRETENTDSNEGPNRERKEWPLIPEDIIASAEVARVSVKPARWTDDSGKHPDRVNFGFKITDGEFQNQWVWGETSTKLSRHPDCRLRAWITEIYEIDELPKDFEFDTDDLMGLPCRVMIGVRTNQNGEQRNFVKDVVRARQLTLAHEIF